MLFTGNSRLAAATLLLGAAAASSAHASSWASIQGKARVLVPKPSLSAVVAPNFNYGTAAEITLGDFGDTSAIYYRQYHWQGDASNGSYATPSSWQCQDLATLKSNNLNLKLNFSDSGRYKYDVVAVMRNTACDLRAFAAGNLVASPIYSSNEFLVIKDDTLTLADSSLAQSTATHSGKLSSYDLRLKWLAIDGASSYQVALKKDHVPYYFNVTDSDYRSQLLINNRNYYEVKDQYDQATGTFTPYTGFGDYNFSVKYCLNNNCSKDIDYQGDDLTVKPLAPRSFYAETSDNKTITLDFIADPRTPAFKFISYYQAPGATDRVVSTLPLKVPDGQTQTTTTMTGGLPYNYYVRQYTPGNDGKYWHDIVACKDTLDDCQVTKASGSTFGATIVYQDDQPEGEVDSFIPGSDKITGWARDNDAQSTEVKLLVNGIEIPGLTATANQARNGSNYGFELTNLAATLSNNGIDTNKTLAMEVMIRNMPYAEFKPLQSFTLLGLDSGLPHAVNDAFSVQTGQVNTLNVLANDFVTENYSLSIDPASITQPAHGSVSIINNLIEYTPSGSSLSSDSFTYQAQYTLPNNTVVKSNPATVHLYFSQILAKDDVVYTDWSESSSSFTSNGNTALSRSTSQMISHNVLSNDSNVSFGDVSVVLQSNQGASGQFTVNADNSVTYTLTGSILPSDCATYQVKKGNDEISNPAKFCVYMGMKPYNDSIGVSANSSANSDKSKADIFVLHNDNILVSPGVTKKPFVRMSPTKGTVVIKQAQNSLYNNGDFYIEYTPKDGVSGLDTFTYSIQLNNEEPLTGVATVTVAIGELPVKPSFIVNDAVSGSTIDMRWSNVAGATTYEFQHAYSALQQQVGNLQEVMWQTLSNQANQTTYQLTNATAGYHYFRVRTCGAQGYNCSGWENSAEVIVLPEILDAPTIAGPNSSGHFVVNWQRVDGLISYRLDNATCTTSCDQLAPSDWSGTTIQGSEKQLVKDKTNGTFAYRVRACLSGGHCAADSPMVTVTTNGVNSKKVFLHTDLLGSPVVESDENGNEL